MCDAEILLYKIHWCATVCSYTYRKVWYWSYCSKGIGPCKKQSHCRPGQALRVPARWGSQISRQLAHEGGKVVSPTHRLPLPPRKYSWYSFLLRGWVNPRAILWPEVLCQWKYRMTPSRMKPAIFRLVARCLNQLRHRGQDPVLRIYVSHVGECCVGTWPFWVENFAARYFYAYHIYIYIYIYIYIVAHQLILFNNMSASQIYIYSCHYLFVTLYMWIWYINFIYFFVLISPWGCWCIAETYRRAHVYGWFVILYKLCAFFYIYVGNYSHNAWNE